MITRFELILGVSVTAITLACSLLIINKAVNRINSKFSLPLTIVSVLWFGLIFVLGANGVFRPQTPSPVPVGIAIFLPVVLGSFLIVRYASIQNVLLNIPYKTLLQLNVARYIGSLFIWFYINDKLPPTFALSAGLGDCFVATLALFLISILKRKPNSIRELWIFNILGIVDFMTAVTLGTLSSDGPQRLIFETPTSGLIGELPLILIPGFGVPFTALVHVISVMKLRRESKSTAENPEKEITQD
ncbi:hypothetical protein [Leptospira yasudae]|uniref:Uncharacterized protein n=1 Tax=Leptospira yasudae TaxID=2202201 RepID=A0A6N4QVE5_9LEPT|nr:hypothetical protein [Leptospira yasudae]TGL76775.1 hypothetical protein EHQ72_13180 [Leptospira yasudae]TGL82062.1 hypothetical protein EHQ83_14650 [Leptospira yasudae]TGL84208.1 hypothetical protein EHQ77_00635 [Leptospira yasudae]